MRGKRNSLGATNKSATNYSPSSGLSRNNRAGTGMRPDPSAGHVPTMPTSSVRCPTNAAPGCLGKSVRDAGLDGQDFVPGRHNHNHAFWEKVVLRDYPQKQQLMSYLHNGSPKSLKASRGQFHTAPRHSLERRTLTVSPTNTPNSFAAKCTPWLNAGVLFPGQKSAARAYQSARG